MPNELIIAIKIEKSLIGKVKSSESELFVAR